jgi:hypothetical protein
VKTLTRSVLLALGIAAAILAADPLSERCWTKLKRIDSGEVKRGSVIIFTSAELNAWGRGHVPQMFEGIRDPRLQLETGAATGTALVDFLKMRKGQGTETNALLGKLIEGERPLKVSVRLESGQGRATVYLTSVELSGITLSGAVLDFLVKDVFLPLFPAAKINQPFELRDNIDRIDIRPDGVRVTIRK